MIRELFIGWLLFRQGQVSVKSTDWILTWLICLWINDFSEMWHVFHSLIADSEILQYFFLVWSLNVQGVTILIHECPQAMFVHIIWDGKRAIKWWWTGEVLLLSIESSDDDESILDSDTDVILFVAFDVDSDFISIGCVVDSIQVVTLQSLHPSWWHWNR